MKTAHVVAVIRRPSHLCNMQSGCVCDQIVVFRAIPWASCQSGRAHRFRAHCLASPSSRDEPTLGFSSLAQK